MNEALSQIAAMVCEMCEGSCHRCQGYDASLRSQGITELRGRSLCRCDEPCPACQGNKAKYPETRQPCTCKKFDKFRFMNNIEFAGDRCQDCHEVDGHSDDCGVCEGSGWEVAPVAEAAWALVKRMKMEVYYGVGSQRWHAVRKDRVGPSASGDTPEAAVFNEILKVRHG